MRYFSTKEYRRTARQSTMMCSESLADVDISSSTPHEPGTESNFGNVSGYFKQQAIADKPV